MNIMKKWTRAFRAALTKAKQPAPTPRQLKPMDDRQKLLNAMSNWQRTQYSRSLGRLRKTGMYAQPSIDFVQKFATLERPTKQTGVN